MKTKGNCRRRLTAWWLITGLLAAGQLWAQVTPDGKPWQEDWRRIGNAAVEVGLPSVATGPVERVWYSADGSHLYVETRSGRVFRTGDFARWRPVTPAVVPPAEPGNSALPAFSHPPEVGAKLFPGADGSATLYALGHAVYRSDDGGMSWSNLTDYHRQSILGGGFTDLAVSPRDEKDIVVAGRFGVWRSLDGGLSWAGLNDSLPNLPVRRILGLPSAGRGIRVLAGQVGAIEWAPGERTGWRPIHSPELDREQTLRNAVAAMLGVQPVSVAAAGDFLYAGSGAGDLWVSPDRGTSWRRFHVPGGGPVERIFVVPGETQVALAAVGSRPGRAGGAHVLRTTNGGIFWDDLTANLPDVAAHGITADAATGSVYVATDAGVFFTVADLRAAGPATDWTRLASPATGSAAVDVRLDDAGNQLYVAIDGQGVYAMMAPHRFLVPMVVNAADLRAHPAAPGGLLTVLGKKIEKPRAGDLAMPLLAASRGESQLQVPYEVTGNALSLTFIAAGDTGQPRRYSFGLPLRPAAPAIFVDRDGTPMILDADSGVLLDAMKPAHPGSRIQILATGLGKVTPVWPTGMPAPLANPPRVVIPVRVFLDRMPIDASRATLAPGYVGFYVVEFYVPDIVNSGPAELYIQAGGETSNRTRIYLEP